MFRVTSDLKAGSKALSSISVSTENKCHKCHQLGWNNLFLVASIVSALHFSMTSCMCPTLRTLETGHFLRMELKIKPKQNQTFIRNLYSAVRDIKNLIMLSLKILKCEVRAKCMFDTFSHFISVGK